MGCRLLKACLALLMQLLISLSAPSSLLTVLPDRRSGEAWKKKWKNLRDTYQKRKKEQRKYRSALGARKKIKWRWSRMMQFLDPYLDTKSIDTSTPATAEDDTASHKSSDKEDMDSELDRERQYSSWSAALSSYSFRAVPRNSTTSVDQIIEGSQAVGYPEDAFFKSCALRAKKLPFQTRSFLQLQITQLFVNAENPELPPIPITPLPSHQHFRDSSTVASDIPLQQRPAEGQHALISCASDQPHNEEEGKHQATDIMNTAIAEIYN